MNQDNLVWIDTKTTGMNPRRDSILQVACVVTDKNLNVIAEHKDIAIHHSKDFMDNMGEWCIEQHGKSGLTQQVLDSKLSLRDAEQHIYDFMLNHVGENISPMCGSSIRFNVAGCGKTYLMKYILHRSQDYKHDELGHRLVMYLDCSKCELPDNISDFITQWLTQNDTELTFDIVWKLMQNEWVVLCLDNVNNDSHAFNVGELLFSVGKVGDTACVMACKKGFEDGVYEAVNWVCDTSTYELLKPSQNDIDYGKENWMLERLAYRVAEKMGVKKDKIKLNY